MVTPLFTELQHVQPALRSRGPKGIPKPTIVQSALTTRTTWLGPSGSPERWVQTTNPKMEFRTFVSDARFPAPDALEGALSRRWRIGTCTDRARDVLLLPPTIPSPWCTSVP